MSRRDAALLVRVAQKVLAEAGSLLSKEVRFDELVDIIENSEIAARKILNEGISECKDEHDFVVKMLTLIRALNIMCDRIAEYLDYGY